MSDSATVQASLHERLGGKAGIETIVHEVVEAHMTNPVIAPRFLPYRDEPEKLAVIKGHLRDFFGAGAGGPEIYSGRSMSEAHAGMNISTAEYVAAIDDILKVLRARGIDDQTQSDVLAIVYSLKEEMIGK